MRRPRSCILDTMGLAFAALSLHTLSPCLGFGSLMIEKHIKCIRRREEAGGNMVGSKWMGNQD